MGSGNAYTPAVSTQIRYITQWFQEWGDMQRNDFLPVLVDEFHSKNNMNGLVSSLDSTNLKDRPPSIFQCRIKLFKEWCENWNSAEKEQLIGELRAIDADFIEKYEQYVNGTVEPKADDVFLTNGNAEPAEVAAAE